MDEYNPTPEQKKAQIIEALGIAGFTENPEFTGIYTQEHGMKKIVVDLTVGTSVYFMENKQKVVDDDEYDTLAKVSKMITEAEDGRMPARTEADIVVPLCAQDGTPEQPDDAQTGVESTPSTPANMLVVPEVPRALTPAVPSDLSVATIKKYINDKATDEEAYVFLQLCIARNLNPFTGDVFLIKYDHTKPAKMVVGKDAIMQRAERNINFDGFEAGVIIKTTDENIIRRSGSFCESSEILMGGWAKVYRKDLNHIIESEVSMNEYSTGQALWKTKPATMIRKVGLVQALREAFPSELSGMYDQSEMGVEVVT